MMCTSTDDRVIKRISPSFTTRSDYFNRVALHNWLFPDTAYDLQGFMVDIGKRVDTARVNPFNVIGHQVFNRTARVILRGNAGSVGPPPGSGS